jgi:uncharacterized protein
VTDQEKQLISGLADQIRNAPPPQIDRDAYDLILHTIGTRPDALYTLTQSVIIQQIALDQAKAQIDQLQRQAAPPAPQQGSFLPGGAPGGWGQDPRYQGSGYEAPPPPAGGRFSNFLHNAATTAAGVIAGELAFDSLASLFGHRGGYYGGGGFLGGGVMPGSETIVNNYYGDERGGGAVNDSGDSRFADAASQDQGISPDIDDERDNSGDSFASGDDSGDDSSFDSGDDGGSSDF